ncbi:MAG TPA: dihydrolipoyllysine-residue acetyltransferase [Solirubrobacterales bacterium]|jgi:pyruvate dehydrogenase E2 component (dihydrolipoamide acetyltransferase)
MAQREVVVPDIGDFSDVPVIEILVNEGDEVQVDAPLVTLESDKATMDVPAPFAGKVVELKVKVNDTVSEGTPLLVMEVPEEGEGAAGSTQSAPVEAGVAAAEQETGSGQAAQAPPPSAPEPAPAPSAAPAQPAASDGGAPGRSGKDGPIYASPAVRRLARELGVDLRGVKGTGRKGRITKEDVRAAKERPAQAAAPEGAALPGLNLAPWPKDDFSKYGEIERVPLTRIKKIAGPNLARNWIYIPHVTHNDEADITDLEAFRKQINAEQDVKVTMTALLIKACVASLRQFPNFNSSLDGDELIVKRYYNIGFAADTPQGLMVPVIKEVDRKGLLQIAAELRELSTKAREGKISAEDLRGSTFTISSLGGIGGTSFTPIVNAPDVAILGVTRAQMKPVWNGEEFVPRLMLPLSLSYDHRVIDGAEAARFVAHLATELADLRRALL